MIESDAIEISRTRLNALDAQTLFDLYRSAGFLYDAKFERIRPVLPRIIAGWQRALCAGSSLLRVMTFEDASKPRFASVSSWRTTDETWSHQHLVSRNGGVAALLGAVFDAGPGDVRDVARTMWFRPENRLPSRIFGEVIAALDSPSAVLDDYVYCELPRSRARSRKPLSVDPHALEGTIVRDRGLSYWNAESFAADPFLSAAGERFRQAGLHRSRRVFATDRGPLRHGVALVATRGPLGLNLSFLENRIDLVCDPAISDEQALAVLPDLFAACMAAYEDFELDWIPLLVPESRRAIAERLGLSVLRRYRKMTVAREDYAAWRSATLQALSPMRARVERGNR